MLDRDVMLHLEALLSQGLSAFDLTLEVIGSGLYQHQAARIRVASHLEDQSDPA